MRIIELAVGLSIFLGTACVVAFLTALLGSYGLGISAAELRLNALISAGFLGFIVVVAIVGGADEQQK